MRALLYDGESARLVSNHPEPEPNIGEAVIRPMLMGICATDLQICRGYMAFRGVLGHEFVGVVERVGDGASKKWIGRRVVGAINAACNACSACYSGIPEHCPNRTVLGILGRDGCFADRFALPVENLLEVSDAIEDHRAVFTEPIAAAFEILEQVSLLRTDRVTVLGDGRLGLLCAQVLRLASDHVRCVGKHPEKLALCGPWGVDAIPLSEVEPDRSQDVVVDATGSATGLETAFGLVRPRGKVVLKTTVSATTRSRPVDLSPIVIDEIEVIGSRCGPFDPALRALEARTVDVEALVSRRFPLDEAPRALELAGRRGTLKVLLST